QEEHEQAVMHFRELAAEFGVPRGVLKEAIAAFDIERRGAELTLELKDLAFADDANPALAGLWAERTAAAGMFDALADRLPELLSRNVAGGRAAVLAYAWAVAEAKKPVQGIVQKYNDVLRAD